MIDTSSNKDQTQIVIELYDELGKLRQRAESVQFSIDAMIHSDSVKHMILNLSNLNEDTGLQSFIEDISETIDSASRLYTKISDDVQPSYDSDNDLQNTRELESLPEAFEQYVDRFHKISEQVNEVVEDISRQFMNLSYMLQRVSANLD